tara:strand:- start:842 stop:1609 length:768 start_codon:yes stop_codon:yes gene_type:complete
MWKITLSIILCINVMMSEGQVDTIEWSGYEWLPQERWGQIHPDKSLQWYDPSAIEINDKDQLILKTHRNPKYFEELDVVSIIGVGFMSNTTEFKYGYFEVEAMLPTGKFLWPAFWMWSFQSWPPEIDIFEGYTKNRGGYFRFDIKNPLGFWHVNTNVHLGYMPDNYSIGAKSHWMGFKNPAKHFIKYGCEWTKDHIKIYYDGRLVRHITDDDVMDKLKGKTMNIIINNAVQDGIDLDDPTQSEFIINYFKYEPYE